MSALFTPEPISPALAEAMKQGGHDEGLAPLSFERLRHVAVAYTTFEGETREDGELIVADAAAVSIAAIFAELYERRFPLRSVLPAHRFMGDDEASMTANNTSCLNCRKVAGSSALSVHAYGLAVDVNPEQNPYLRLGSFDTSTAEVFPAAGKPFINRAILRPGMAESVKDLFAGHGLNVWGGMWVNPPDWHHFQTPRLTAELIALLPPAEARDVYLLSAESPALFTDVPLERAEAWKALARTDAAACLKATER